jgi:hypothetical protein
LRKTQNIGGSKLTAYREYQNHQFWRRRTVSLEAVLTMPSGERLPQEVSAWLNQFVSPSPESELIAEEIVMQHSINFSEVTHEELSEALPMTKEAFDLLKKAEVEASAEELEVFFKDGKLTKPKAKEFLAQPKFQTSATVLREAGHDKTIEFLQEMADQTVVSIYRAAYWVALMIRPRTPGEFNNAPVTHEEARTAIAYSLSSGRVVETEEGAELSLVGFVRGDPSNDRRTDTVILTPSQWNLLERNGIRVLNGMHRYKQLKDIVGIEYTVNVKDAFDEIVEQNERNAKQRRVNQANEHKARLADQAQSAVSVVDSLGI